MNISIVVLAAGNSKRFSGNKLLAPWKHTTVFRHLLSLVCQLEQVKIVTVIKEELLPYVKHQQIQVVVNQRSELGLSHSLKLGIDACKECDAILFMVADQPNIKKETLQSLLNCADQTHIICASDEEGYKNPVLFPKCYFELLKQLTKDQGGKQVVRQNVHQVIEVRVDKEELMDIDTQQAYQSFYERYGKEVEYEKTDEFIGR